jgi:colanic acid biosynthesis glycosyl transferase WcaI
LKILIYGINFAPELTGTGKYTGEMAGWLAGHGHEVRVVTAPPYYPGWQVADGYSASRYRRQDWRWEHGESKKKNFAQTNKPGHTPRRKIDVFSLR